MLNKKDMLNRKTACFWMLFVAQKQWVVKLLNGLQHNCGIEVKVLD